MMQDILSLSAGVGLAWWGGEWFVRGLVAGASWARVPAGLVGVTIAAFATSTPELAVGIRAASQGIPQLSLGDVLGSNVANVALFLAVGLLISGKKVNSGTVRRDFTAALLAPVLVALVGGDGVVSRLDAMILLLAFSIWLGFVIMAAWRSSASGRREGKLGTVTIAMGFAGLLLLFAAGYLIVSGAQGIAEAVGLDPFLIGTVLVAVATGTPELATTIVAKLRGHHDLGVGNIYGSNLFNVWFILPVVALIRPIHVANVTELLLTLGFGVVTTLATYPRKGTLGRDRGLLLLTLYIGFIASLWLLAVQAPPR